MKNITKILVFAVVAPAIAIGASEGLDELQTRAKAMRQHLSQLTTLRGYAANQVETIDAKNRDGWVGDILIRLRAQDPGRSATVRFRQFSSPAKALEHIEDSDGMAIRVNGMQMTGFVQSLLNHSGVLSGISEFQTNIDAIRKEANPLHELRCYLVTPPASSGESVHCAFMQRKEDKTLIIASVGILDGTRAFDYQAFAREALEQAIYARTFLLKSSLTDLREQSQRPTGFGIDVETLGESERLRMGAGCNCGYTRAVLTRTHLKIVRVAPGQAPGLQPGDALVSLNGQGVSSRADLDRLLKSTPSGSSAAFEVIRIGGVDDFDWPERKTILVRIP